MFLPVTSGGSAPTVKTINKKIQPETLEQKLNTEMETKQNDRDGREDGQKHREVTKGGGQETQTLTGKNLVNLNELFALSHLVDQATQAKRSCCIKSLCHGNCSTFLMYLRN